jgi:uncharacterized membrane protein
MAAMTNPLPLDTADVLALAFFLACWILFGLGAEGRLAKRVSSTQAMNAQRRRGCTRWPGASSG